MNIPPPTITPTLNLQALETSLLSINNSIQNTTVSTIFDINAQYLTDYHTILDNNSFHDLNVPIFNDQAVPKIYVDTKTIIPSQPNLSIQFKKLNSQLNSEFGGSINLTFDNNNTILNGTLFTTNITTGSLTFSDKILLEASEYIDSDINMKLPNQIPGSRVALRTNGIDELSWTTLSSSSGLEGYVQFNDSGVFGSDSTFTYSTNDKILTVENIETNNISSSIIQTTDLELEGSSGTLSIKAPISLTTNYSITLPTTIAQPNQILSVYENQLYWSNNGTVNNNITGGIIYNNEQSFETSSQFVYSETNNELTISNLINTDSYNISFYTLTLVNNNNLNHTEDYNKIFINNNLIYLIGNENISKYTIIDGGISYQTSIYLNNGNIKSMTFDNNFIYSVSSINTNTYSIINKININSFTTIDSIIISGMSNYILIEEGIIYSVGEKLNILNYNLNLLSNTTLNGIASKVIKNNNYLLISTNNLIFSLNTYDITDLNNPILVKYLSLGNITDMVSTINELYTVGDYLNKINIQKPENMTLQNSVSFTTLITTINLINNDIYILTESENYFIINSDDSFQTKYSGTLNYIFTNSIYPTFSIYGNYLFFPAYVDNINPLLRFSFVLSYNISSSNITSSNIGNIKSQSINNNQLIINGIYSSDGNINTNTINTTSVNLYEPNSLLEYSITNNEINSNSGNIIFNNISFTTETKLFTINNNNVSNENIIVLKVLKWNKVNTVLIPNIKTINNGSFIISIDNIGQVTTSPGHLELFFVIY